MEYPSDNNKVSEDGTWCRHGVNRGICQDCNLRKTLGFPEQTAKVPYRIEGDVPAGGSVVWEFDTVRDERPRQRKPPLPESALLFRSKSPREEIAFRHHAGSRNLLVFTKHGGLHLHPGQVYELLAGLIAYICILNGRKVPREVWSIPKEVDRLISEKVARLVEAYEEAAKKTYEDRGRNER